MGLIKSTQAPLSLTAFSMADIERAARSMIATAERKARELLIEAQKEAEVLKTAARKEGAEVGRRLGHAAGLEAGTKTGHEQALAEHREQLAIAIAQRVTKRLGALDGDVVRANVAEALKLVVHAADLRIAVHPSQKGTLTDALPRLRLEWPSLDHVELTEDAALAPGGCRIWTRHGSIDADLDVQLRNIAAELAPESP